MKQKDWKIIYTRYDGISKKAINLLSKEAGRLLIREEMVYSIYVLPCEKEGAPTPKSAFIVGIYEECETARKYLAPDEVPEDGFAVKVMKNPENEEGNLVILTARSEINLFYSVVSFIDNYIPSNAPCCGSNRMADLIFDYPLTECTYSEVCEHKKRSIFTWGHSINDYRAYIDNMARLRLNEVIIWNDYIPINIDEIIDYAHSYGISVVLGYSWGWREIGNKAAEITVESINRVKEIAINAYRNSYAPVKCDGIYFQSFTERSEASVGGKLISELVTDMVNEIADELWRITPDLRLIFGLHASSVKKNLEEIAHVNPKIEILWEDCGQYPFDYAPFVKSEEAYIETLAFVKKILELRGGKGVGLVFKGTMMLDWSKAVGQSGPYVMGENAGEIADHDRRMRAKAWRKYASEWMVSGARLYEMMKFINENEKFDTAMCLAGTFDGGIYLPFALAAELIRDTGAAYPEILKRVSRRACIRVD